MGGRDLSLDTAPLELQKKFLSLSCRILELLDFDFQYMSVEVVLHEIVLTFS